MIQGDEMKRLTKINCCNVHELKCLHHLRVLLVVVLVNISFVALAKAEVNVELVSHPGINIVSPPLGSTHEPGSFINVEVNVDPALNISEILVLASASRTGIDPVILSSPLFSGAMAIPNEYTGAMTLSVVASDTTGTVVGTSEAVFNVVSSEVPASIYTGNDVEFMAPGEGGTQVRPVAIYSNGVHRHVRTQSSFSSSNPAVASVTADGLVAAVSKGVAFVSAEFMGKTAYAEIRVRDPVLNEDIAVENTSNASIVKGGIRVDRATGRFVQQVTVTNTGTLPLAQPLWLAISNLPSGVSLANQEGVTENLGVLGSPLVGLDVRDANQQSFLVPGSSTSAILEFTNVNSVSIDYATRIFSAGKP